MSEEIERHEPLDTDRDPGRHRHALSLLLILVGGAVGTFARFELSTAFPAVDSLPWAILGINVVGALLLGALVEGLALRGPDVGSRRQVRLALGTGVLGGFTTYSTLAVGTAQLLLNGQVLLGAVYAIGSVIVGALAAFAGIRIVRAIGGTR